MTPVDLVQQPVVAPCPDAPGLWVAALYDAERGLSATGLGRDAARAEGRCRSEAVERRYAQDLDARPWGMAVAKTRDAARARAGCEMAERLAVRHWWRTGAARALPPGLAAVARGYIRDVQEVARARAGLLDLTGAGGPPVVLAWSADADGRGLSLGFGCADDPADAVRHAIRERCQMVFGLGLARRRDGQGAGDAAALARAEALTCADVPLAPTGGAGPEGLPLRAKRTEHRDPDTGWWVATATPEGAPPWRAEDWPMYL